MFIFFGLVPKPTVILHSAFDQLQNHLPLYFNRAFNSAIFEHAQDVHLYLNWLGKYHSTYQQ